MVIGNQLDRTTLLGKATDSSTIDLRHGAQQGYLPKIMGIDAKGEVFDEWASNAAHVKNNVICIPLSAPGFIDLVTLDTPTVRKLKRFYSDLFSVHPLTIDGLDSTVTLEAVTHNVGPNMKQHEFVKSNRAESVPVFTFQEKLGKPIQKYLDFLISYGIMDPDTQSALVAAVSVTGDTLADKQSHREVFRGSMYTPDFKTGSMLFIELDFLNVNVVDAWYLVNMAPLSSGTRQGKRDLASARELSTYSITMTGMQIVGAPINAFAQNLVNTMNVFTRIPDEGHNYLPDGSTPLTGVVSAEEFGALNNFEGDPVDQGRNGYNDNSNSLASDINAGIVSGQTI